MRFSNEEAIRQIDGVLKEIEDNFENSYKTAEDNKNIIWDTDITWLSSAMMKIQSCIDRLTPHNSKYIEECSLIKSEKCLLLCKKIQKLKGILEALRYDYENNYLKTFEELINANQFSDYLEMAEYLLSKGYKDSAAVLIGGVLEENIRNLCRKNEIELSETKEDGTIKNYESSVLNNKLKANNIYIESKRAQIEAMLKLRNHAAHGKYGEYKEPDVKIMLDTVRNFIADYPA